MTETITEAQQWELGSLVVCLVISQKLYDVRCHRQESALVYQLMRLLAMYRHHTPDFASTQSLYIVTT
jgi:hypothetical protein